MLKTIDSEANTCAFEQTIVDERLASIILGRHLGESTKEHRLLTVDQADRVHFRCGQNYPRARALGLLRSLAVDRNLGSL